MPAASPRRFPSCSDYPRARISEDEKAWLDVRMQRKTLRLPAF
jgi:hypothetical protein